MAYHLQLDSAQGVYEPNLCQAAPNKREFESIRSHSTLERTPLARASTMGSLVGTRCLFPLLEMESSQELELGVAPQECEREQVREIEHRAYARVLFREPQECEGSLLI